MKKKKILIVEDNPDLNEAYEIIFKSNGFETLVVEDGNYVMEALDFFEPNIMLLDVMLPNINGFDLLQYIRSEGYDVFVVINSNLSQESDIKKGFSLGANEYLRKSDFTANELFKKVESFLN